MFFQSPDIKHETQLNELMSSLGKFIVEFERVCSAFQFLIILCFEREGLKNQGLAQVTVGDKAAAEIRTLFGALYQELPDQDKDDHESVKSLLMRFDKLTTFRNNIVHAEWHLGTETEDDEINALLTKFKAKQNKGAEYRQLPVTKSLIDTFAMEARKQKVLASRLQTALFQKGYKPSRHMNKHNDCELESGLFENI